MAVCVSCYDMCAEEMMDGPIAEQCSLCWQYVWELYMMDGQNERWLMGTEGGYLTSFS